ncbi:MAG: molecular chaperone HtpG [Myxococcales bacterium]|nr:molecular chaperone HtpG [Myxococcales bacterium]
MTENHSQTQTQTRATEQRTFSTEVQQLLHLMVHSLYSKKEIFLRELISNSSDAIDTLRFLALTRPELSGSVEAQESAIELAVDKDAKTLTVRDTGIGMNRQQVIDNIGTIARSGTGALLKRLKEQTGDASKSLDVIGQFGVGFYSVLMVAHKVELDTLSAEPESQPVLFRCDGSGTYELGVGTRTTAGTTVTLYLNDDASEFLETWQIEHIVKQYSNYVKWPVRLEGKQLNRATALWSKRPSEVSEEEYNDFYKELCGGFSPDDVPLAKLHLSIDTPYQFQAIVFVPKKPPFDMMMDQNRRRGMQLYVRRVFILDHAEELLPPWLRFVRGVVDSDDLPLNVSREILQKNQIITTIQKQIIKKVLEELKRVREQKPEEYRAFFEEFGGILKEGIFLDHGNREKVAEVCLWSSLNTPASERITLPEYLSKMPSGQDELYYITGPSRSVVERSPHVEALRKQKLDVLLFIDPIDEWVVQSLTEFSGKKLRAIHKGDFVPPKLVEEPESEAEKQSPEQQTELQALLVQLRSRFQDRIKEVRLSSRLTDSASVLVAEEGDLGPHLEQLLQRAGRKVEIKKPILELNPKSPLVAKLAHLLAVRPGSEEVNTYSDLLLELAYLAQGTVPEPGALLASLHRVLARDLSTLAD